MSRYDVLTKRAAAKHQGEATEHELTAVTRRGNPGYRQFSAYVPLELYRTLKIRLAERELDLSQALEEAIRDWLAKEKKPD
jgi:hypothetical protein